MAVSIWFGTRVANVSSHLPVFYLARRFTTLKTEGNQNNAVGMPLTVLRLGPEDEASVLEMCMYSGGEIRVLAEIGRPSIGMVTAVKPVLL